MPQAESKDTKQSGPGGRERKAGSKRSTSLKTSLFSMFTIFLVIMVVLSLAAMLLVNRSQVDYSEQMIDQNEELVVEDTGLSLKHQSESASDSIRSFFELHSAVMDSWLISGSHLVTACEEAMTRDALSAYQAWEASKDGGASFPGHSQLQLMFDEMVADPDNSVIGLTLADGRGYTIYSTDPATAFDNGPDGLVYDEGSGSVVAGPGADGVGERWWSTALDGLQDYHVGEMEYDDGAGIYECPLSKAVVGSDGGIVGVILMGLGFASVDEDLLGAFHWNIDFIGVIDASGALVSPAGDGGDVTGGLTPDMSGTDLYAHWEMEGSGYLVENWPELDGEYIIGYATFIMDDINWIIASGKSADSAFQGLERSSTLMEEREDAFEGFFIWLMAFIFASIALCFTMILLFIHMRVIDPARKLHDVSAGIAKGKFKRTSITSGDELGKLGRAINRMSVILRRRENELAAKSAQLGKANQELGTLNQYLESRIDERTRQLEEKTRNLASTNQDLAESERRIQQANQELIDANRVVQSKVEEAELARKTSDGVVDNVGDPLIVVDQNFTITRLNKAAEEFTSVRADSVVGHKKCYEVFRTPLCNSSECPVRRCFNTGEPVKKIKTSVKDTGGKDVAIELSASAFTSAEGGNAGAVEIFHDVTKELNRIEELAHEKTKHEMILRSVRNPLYVIDKDMSIQHFNQSAEEFTSVDATEVIGRRKCHEVLNLSICGTDECPAKECFETGGRVDDVQAIYVDVSGAQKDVVCSISPYFDETGELVGAIETVRDITNELLKERMVKNYAENLERLVNERTDELRRRNEQLETREEELQIMNTELQQTNLELSNVMRQISLEKDQEEKYGRFSKMLNETFQIRQLCNSSLSSFAELTDSKVGVFYLYDNDSYTLVPSAYYGINPDASGMTKIHPGEGIVGQAARSGKTQVVTEIPEDSTFVWTVFMQKKPVNCILAVPLLWHDELVGVLELGYMRVVTDEEKRFIETLVSQLAITVHNSQIHARTRRLAHDLEIKNAEVKRAQEEERRANKLKSEFLANMSHELRTPLNSIIGFTRQMMKKPEDGKRNSNFLGRVERNSVHLLDLINGILDLSKIEAGRMGVEPEDFNVSEVLGELLDSFSPLADAKHLTLIDERDRSADTSVRTDMLKFKQIVINLVNNAIKFTDQGTVTIKALTDRSNVIVMISDTGVGIPQDEQNLVFKEFVQADGSTTRAAEGTGLGLSISRKFARLLGGNITLDSEPGEGTTFTIRIPRIYHRPVEEKESEGGESTPEASRGGNGEADETGSAPGEASGAEAARDGQGEGTGQKTRKRPKAESEGDDEQDTDDESEVRQRRTS